MEPDEPTPRSRLAMLLPAVLLAVAGLGPWVIAEVKLKVSGSSDSSAARKRSGATLCSPSWNLGGPLGLPIERDLYFKTGPFSEVIARYLAERGR
jgi:hypothetical protein